MKLLSTMCNTKALISLTVLVLITVVVSSIRIRRWVADDNECRTPNGGLGNYLPLSECPTLHYLASNPNNWKILQNYFRPHRNSLLMVCCPKEQMNEIEHNGPNSEPFPKECGIFQSNHKITNGDNANLFEFPWQVSLRYDGQSNPFGCAGSLINDRYVLTAAHCTRDLKLIGVRLGDYNLDTNPDCQTNRNHTICAPKHIDIHINKEDITEHENYVKNIYKNDISLIRLPRKIEFSDSVSPICLPSKEGLTRDLGNLTVIGWGRTETNKPNPILSKVTVPLMDIDECQKAFRMEIDISDNQFCAGGKEGMDSCKGDSGGPIMHYVVDNGEVRWVQAGIVSYGYRFCGTEGIPAVYTKMTAYMDWIRNHMKP